MSSHDEELLRLLRVVWQIKFDTYTRLQEVVNGLERLLNEAPPEPEKGPDHAKP